MVKYTKFEVSIFVSFEIIQKNIVTECVSQLVSDKVSYRETLLQTMKMSTRPSKFTETTADLKDLVETCTARTQLYTCTVPLSVP